MMIEESLSQILNELQSQRELLNNLKANNAGADVNPVFDIEKASQYLGLSKSQIYRLTSQNQISYFKPNGKKVYFYKDDLNNYINQHRIKSKFELEIIANNRPTKKR